LALLCDFAALRRINFHAENEVTQIVDVAYGIVRVVNRLEEDLRKKAEDAKENRKEESDVKKAKQI
jgi:hypothetical protein